MKIAYLGHSAIKIKTKKATVVIDPFSKEAVGFAMKKTPADIVACSHEHPDHCSLDNIKNDDYFLIKGPGEYELHNVFIKGISSFHDKKKGEERGKITIYIVEAGGVRLCHLGDLGCSLKEKLIDQINGVDVLCVPVGGYSTINVEEAVKVIHQIEPSIVLPIHFATEKHTEEKQKKFAPLSEFLKEWGGKVRREDRLRISKTNLPEETEVVVLKH